MPGPVVTRLKVGERTQRVLFGFLWSMAALAFLMFSSVSDAASVKNVRLGESAGKTRFVVDIDREIAYTYMLLENPYRIVIDLPEVEWQMGNTGIGEGLGLVADYRYGLFQAGTSRLVLDLTGPAVVERVFMLGPQSGYDYRLVIDLEPASQAAFSTEMNQLRSENRKAYNPPSTQVTPAPVSNIRTVVLDAGHGGVDPGTLSVLGIPEKTVVLDVVKAIKKELEASGNYRVLLTRDRDIYVPHAKRVEFARNAGADLFISIHGDSIANKKVRGATIYTLSEKASDKEAAALARKENKSDLIAGVDLGGESPDVANILVDLAMRETMNYSARFAGYLVPELKERMYLRQNSHRFAGFLVLKAPDVPSVLLEIGYLSNREDAKFVTSDKGRRNIAAAIAEAVDRYFTSIRTAGNFEVIAEGD